jgi:hypothetical protein
MSREWTEKHIREMIRKNPKFPDTKQSIIEQLRSVAGLEVRYSVNYPVFLTGNVTSFKITIPGEAGKYCKMFAGQGSFEAPVKLEMQLGSPFASVPTDGRLCDLLAVPTAGYQVQGGFVPKPDDSLLYPLVKVSPMVFNGKTLDGHTLHITEYNHTIWLSKTQSIAAKCYGVYLKGITAWPATWAYNLQATITIGGGT